jgi:cell division protein FtsZ
MLEIQEAAKIITESVDPNAKIIFGAIRDDKVKKNEIKITVIATGFPDAQITGQKGSSLFQVSQKSTDTEKEEFAGKIYNTIGLAQGAKRTAPIRDDRKSKVTVPATENAKEDDSDNDDWGAVPAFLRRSRLK